jgi:hypothetical protein
MIDTFIDYCIDNWPNITIGILVIYLISIVVWKAAKYHSNIEEAKNKVNNLPCTDHALQLREIESLEKEIKNKVNNLPCADHALQLKEIESLKQISSSTNDIVVAMSRWIAGKDKSMIDTFIKKNSPYTITVMGLEMLEESGAKAAIDDNIDYFIGELEAIDPKTPYDVENQSINLVFRNMGNEIFNPVKNYIYYSPETIERYDAEQGKNRTIELSLPGLLNVMGVYVRDLYMQRHPEIEDAQKKK